MSLRNLALFNQNGEALAVTIPNGATQRELVSSPSVVTGGLQLVFVEDMNDAMRRTITFRSKAPTFDAKAKTWSKGRREIAISAPVEVTPGVFQSRTIRVIVECPAMTEADEIVRSIDEAVQIVKHESTQLFLKIGTLD